MNYLVLNG